MNTKKATGVVTNNYVLQDRLSPIVLNKLIEAILYLEDKAQDNYDENLATQAKTILGAINELEEEKEEKANKTTSLSSSSTDTQYPSAKAVYNELQKKSDLLIRTVTVGGNPNGAVLPSVDTITGIENYIPSSDVINYQIWGNIIQNTQPTAENPQEPLFVGDLVNEGTYAGMYKISVTLGNTTYNIYLDEPLRAIFSYGNDNSYLNNYVYDYIDLSEKKIIRNVGKYVLSVSDIAIDDISEDQNKGGAWEYNNNSDVFVRSRIDKTDMRTFHPVGGLKQIDVYSNILQRLYMTFSNNYSLMNNNFIQTVNGHTFLDVHFNLTTIGCTTVLSDATDYMIATRSTPLRYYKVYDSNNNEIESLDDLNTKIKAYFTVNNITSIDIYYPLASSANESISLPAITMPSDGNSVDFAVNTVLQPSKFSIQYYADLPKTIEDIYTKLETLENAQLSQGGNV